MSNTYKFLVEGYTDENQSESSDSSNEVEYNTDEYLIKIINPTKIKINGKVGVLKLERKKLDYYAKRFYKHFRNTGIYGDNEKTLIFAEIFFNLEEYFSLRDGDILSRMMAKDIRVADLLTYIIRDLLQGKTIHPFRKGIVLSESKSGIYQNLKRTRKADLPESRKKSQLTVTPGDHT